MPWKPVEEMTLITKSIPRLDAVAKVTGKAKYAYDTKATQALAGRMLSCPHPNAKAVKIDLSAAEAMPGVKAAIKEEGKICRYAGDFVAAVAAVSEEIADDAIRAIKVEWEQYPFVVREEDARKPGAPVARGEGTNIRSNDPRVKGDVDAAFAEADAVVEGVYSTQAQTHHCLETHGVTCEWDEAQENLTCWASTQGISSVRDNLAGSLKLNPENVRVICDYMGGGFGSKFGAGIEGITAALLAKQAKAPVRVMMTREQDTTTAGNRPSSIQEIKAAATKDGRLTAFEIHGYGTGGIGGGAGFPSPYIYGPENSRVVLEDVYVNAGPGRAFRAPGHPQGSYGTECIMDQLADAIGMDPIEFRKKNDKSPQAEVRAKQFDKAAELIGWERRKATPGTERIRRGFGIASATWGGGGSGTKAHAEIHANGSVVMKCGTQDIGTGIRTLVGMVTAEEMGLPLEAVTVQIGDTRFPASGGSGGSTTTASVTPAIKITAEKAVNELYARVAPVLETTPDNLAASKGRIHRKDDPSKGLSWKEATAVLGTNPISVDGEWAEGLSSSGVAGCAAVEVEVDTWTGDVRLVKAVSVQDSGLIVNKLTYESQLLGAVIQGMSFALYENRIMDRMLGRQINPNMEFYKILSPMDMPEIVPVPWMEPDQMARGVIGVGEPPTIPLPGAVANAVANAIGARVYDLPVTPAKVLDALNKKGEGGV